MTVAKIMISLFSLVNLSMIASGGIIFTLGLTGYWSADANFSYLMVTMHLQNMIIIIFIKDRIGIFRINMF